MRPDFAGKILARLKNAKNGGMIFTL